MKDRLAKHPGRVKLAPVPGQENTYDLVRADEPIVIGSAWDKANVLPDEVCDALGLDTETSEVKDALLAIPAVLGKCLLRITARHADGTPYAGMMVGGLTGIDPVRCVTDNNGRLNVYVTEGNYTLSAADAAFIIDTTINAESVALAAGDIRDVAFQEQYKTDHRVEILSTRGIMFSDMVESVDIFCVGGGGGGSSSGGGGGSGYTKTGLHAAFFARTKYNAVVGAGGATDSSGGTSSLLGVVAGGGAAGTTRGGNGGSGGSCGYHDSASYPGGSDGQSSPDVGNYRGGNGQGATTREFGEAGAKLYAGGGGGRGMLWHNPAGGTTSYISEGGSGGGARGAYFHGNSSGTSSSPAGNPTSNSGGGGGGGSSGSDERPSAGAAGIIIIRWRNKT